MGKASLTTRANLHSLFLHSNFYRQTKYLCKVLCNYVQSNLLIWMSETCRSTLTQLEVQWTYSGHLVHLQWGTAHTLHAIYSGQCSYVISSTTSACRYGPNGMAEWSRHETSGLGVPALNPPQVTDCPTILPGLGGYPGRPL